jgi:hypothetical protein
MVTFAKASREGMVNWGTERLTCTREVTLLIPWMAREMRVFADSTSDWIEVRIVASDEVMPSEI